MDMAALERVRPLLPRSTEFSARVRFKVVTSVTAFAVFIAGSLVMSSRAPAETGPPRTTEAAPRPSAQTPGPVWVPDVVRIDRSRDTRERVVPDGTDRRHFVVATQAAVARDGSFSTNEGRIRIAGIRLPERGRVCRTADGRRWACGVRAFVAFSTTIARRGLDCRPVSAGPDARPPLHDCLMDRRSLAETLVSAGWVEVDPASANEKLTALGARAKVEGVGLWANAPPEDGTPPEQRR